MSFLEYDDVGGGEEGYEAPGVPFINGNISYHSESVVSCPVNDRVKSVIRSVLTNISTLGI